MNKVISIICILTSLFLADAVKAATIVDENFNNRSYPSAIKFYGPSGYDKNIQYGTGRGGSGYAIERNDAVSSAPIGFGTVMVWPGFSAALRKGVYIRYWEKFASNYDMSDSFWNNKILKVTGPDIEWILNKDNGSSWTNIRGQAYGSNGVFSWHNNLATPMTRGDWHKIEIYIRVPSSGTCIQHLTIDDKQVWYVTTSLRRSISANTEQPWSVKASNSGSANPGKRWLDDLKIVTGEGDLTGSGGGSPPIIEKPEPPKDEKPEPPKNLHVVE